MTHPAVFLDRDGTIIHDTGYLSRAADVRLIDGAADALRRLADASFLRIVITNQSGIGRGMYRAADFDAVQRELELQLSAAGASLTATAHCPHVPDDGCACRKPGTALHREMAAIHDIDLSRSWCVGDRVSDVIAARDLGAGAVLVRSGEGERHAADAAAAGVIVVRDIGEAADWITVAASRV